MLELYKQLCKSVTPEEKSKNGEELLNTLFFEMQIEDDNVISQNIITMYEDGLISLENILDFDSDYIKPMLDKLSLDDAAKIRKKMSYEELVKLVDSVFLSENISDESKFIMIMNLFGEDTKEDKDARETYISLLEFDGESERRALPTGGKRTLTGNSSSQSNKYVYPDFVKWKFYKALDKDVRVTRYSNGYVEFASSKLGVRIIEKYYDGDKPAYGTATYMMSEKDYRDNQSELITLTRTGKILESSEMKRIVPRKDRIAHRTQSTKKTWMDEIVRYFDIDFEREFDTRYTEEELKELRETIEKYKTQYEMIL